MKQEQDENEFDEDDDDEELNEHHEKLDRASLKLQAQRDEAFLCNIDYLFDHQQMYPGKLLEANVADDTAGSITPFIRFVCDGTPFYVKKATLIWWLSTDGKRVSTDRIYRFVNDRTPRNDKTLETGDFVEMKQKGVNRIVQIIRFRFADGKTFHGDQYKADKSDQQVEALCNFFDCNNGIVTGSESCQRYINMKHYQKHVFLKRNLETGTLSLI